ncbi:multicopper oxidase family protein [Nitrincola tapanii]|uniref:Multicopper oxidase family protein n=1 Tax=Nitrincola tapanii TaxID=1708751 RepID=A0A5A9W6N6_9GAMM|nr:multicopper oxidase family protein [Nitrincola tapanii]KAA0876447.1 multicopper oxidase family protein [Nitrincola tapanii]
MLRRDFLRISFAGVMVAPLYACMPKDHDHEMADHLMEHAAKSLKDWAAAFPQHLDLRPLPRIQNQVEWPNFQSQFDIAPTSAQLTYDLQSELWLYDGKLAPVIEVEEGGQVEVRVRNQLNQPTTIHWHGVKVPADQDGGPHEVIPPQGEHLYRFRVPEGNAGLHWFHPHAHGYLAEQIARSLAGVLWVKPKDDPIPQEIRSYLMMVTDLRLDVEGHVDAHSHLDWMNGREGDILLVNGLRNPMLEVAPGATFRLRLINACAGRYLRLQLQEHDFHLIGTDGGYLEQPVLMSELLLVPGQRCDLLVRATTESHKNFALQNLPYDRDWMGEEPEHYRRTENLMLLRTQNLAVEAEIRLPEYLTQIPEMQNPSVYRTLTLSEEMGSDALLSAGHEMADHGGHPPLVKPHENMRFMINGQTYQPGRVMFEGQVGQVEEWEIFNQSHMDHPFHIHGTQFQVVALQEDGQSWSAPAYRAWQDTVNLQPKQRLKLRVVFEQPGEWMFHCHIIEHEELGMMSSIRVV